MINWHIVIWKSFLCHLLESRAFSPLKISYLSKAFLPTRISYLRSYLQDLFASVSVVLSMDLSKMDKIRVSKPSTQALTDFMPIYSFLTPWKHQKTTGFLMLSGGYEKKILTWNRLIQILDIDPKEAAVGWVEEVIVRRVPEKNVALKVDSLAVAFKIFFRR